ncbi:MAG: Tol-Pal system subunit TolQ [Halobacteriovoraceae bacterium]|nr:Tol-Pal system subunit TolQ [Halobacteriovoraceae bacterium]|tara:strand:- start:26928 stop:27638 length:711 start_codon:yes stop_codon:yes gene_type:complete
MEVKHLDLLQILMESGIVVKLVLLILIGCSVLSWAIIFQKKKKFQLTEQEDEKFYGFFKNSNNIVEIKNTANEFSASPLSQMYHCGYDELTKIKEKLGESGQNEKFRHYINNHGITALERSLKQGANVSRVRLSDRLALLATIGSVTPFIGLFGTVWGIIDSFAGLASGGGSIEAVAPGIAEALVATAVGLAAAIPAVWGYNTYNTKLALMTTRMENFGQEFLNLIERNVLGQKEE